MLKAFCEMQKVRNFKLVLCADGVDYRKKAVLQGLKQIVATERAEGGLYNLSSEPLVTCTPWGEHRPLFESFEHTLYPRGRISALNERRSYTLLA